MKCPKCGKENKRRAEFCKFCGENLKEPEQQLTLSFMLKSLFIIYVLIFLFYVTYLAVEPQFQKFVDTIATK